MPRCWHASSRRSTSRRRCVSEVHRAGFRNVTHPPPCRSAAMLARQFEAQYSKTQVRQGGGFGQVVRRGTRAQYRSLLCTM